MRQDQYERLSKLEEKLMDVFLTEADPDSWPGKDMPIASMDAQTRGDRYWSKKNAAASGVLLHRTATLIGTAQAMGGTTPGDGSDEDNQLDAEISSAEKDVARLMLDMQRKSKKTAFDKRVHGKTTS